jgi:hypothetical protein
MATSTIVITYTAGSAGTTEDVVTSATEAGTAWGSWTEAQVKNTLNRLEQLRNLIIAENGNKASSAILAPDNYPLRFGTSSKVK